MTTTSMLEYLAVGLVCAGMLVLVAVGVVNIRINLRRRPFNYRALTVAGAVGVAMFMMGMIIPIWPESVGLALVFVGLAICLIAFSFFYSRRLSRRYETEGRR